ncbi:MAG: protein-L-isoaspartate(D-aspartate) O-methyltransferase [Flavobacteriaceae bacterium]|nr:protein-L-isoaspartate(D-aspartate) O-methyltransferase [Flavobacteriaceae bacterium]
MQDSFIHKGKRKQLLDKLRQKGISDAQVLDAMDQVPRHLFMDSSFLDHAYSDKAFPIAADQTISQPFTVAKQTELLQCAAGQKILEIGTGSGYQSAVLVALGVQLYTIERQNELFKKSSLLLKKMGFNPKKLIFGDGYKGYPEQAPYDGIIVTAGAPFVPMPLLAQLKIGGRLVIPLGEKDQIMTVFERVSEKKFDKSTHGPCKFVPLLANKN